MERRLVHPIRVALSKAAEHDGRWHCHQIALGDEPGQQEILLTKKTVYQSFLHPSSFGLDSFANLGAVSSERVTIATLDSFSKDPGKNFGARWLLKMDTQGYDLKVFDGSLGCLDRIVSLVSELSFRQIYAGMPDYAESLAHYRRHGFVPSAIYAVARRGLSLVEADCFLVRDGDAAPDRTSGGRPAGAAW